MRNYSAILANFARFRGHIDRKQSRKSSRPSHLRVPAAVRNVALGVSFTSHSRLRSLLRSHLLATHPTSARAALGALLLGLSSLLASACGGGTRPSGSAPAPLVETHTIVVDGRERRYLLHLPRDFDGRSPLPLVLAFHGAGQTAAELRELTGLDAEADRLDFAVVYPEAGAPASSSGRWGFGCADCSPGASPDEAPGNSEGVDDVRLATALVERIADSVPLDRGRIYAVGLSLGGVFAFHLACREPERIAAFAVVGALLPAGIAEHCARTPPVGALVMLGSADPFFPWAGGIVGTSPMLGAGETMRFWAERDGCMPPVDVELLPPRNGTDQRIERAAYARCDGGSEVRLYRLEGGGHIWPTDNLHASREIAEFLLRQGRAGAPR